MSDNETQQLLASRDDPTLIKKKDLNGILIRNSSPHTAMIRFGKNGRLYDLPSRQQMEFKVYQSVEVIYFKMFDYLATAIIVNTGEILTIN
jgi:hypothetical protein